MQAVKYPVYKSHKAIHVEFTETAIRWMEEYQAGRLHPEAVLDALVEVCYVFQTFRDMLFFQQLVYPMVQGDGEKGIWAFVNYWNTNT